MCVFCVVSPISILHCLVSKKGKSKKRMTKASEKGAELVPNTSHEDKTSSILDQEERHNQTTMMMTTVRALPRTSTAAAARGRARVPGMVLVIFWLAVAHTVEAFTLKPAARGSLAFQTRPTTHRTAHHFRLADDNDDHDNDDDDHDDSRGINEDTASDSIRRRLLDSFAVTAAVGTAALIPFPATATATPPPTKYLLPTPPRTAQQYWPAGKVAFSLLPLAGTSTIRATIEECIVPDTIWTHDQIQGIVNVNVPVRQTVIKLSDKAGGGLWVHNPVAPTPELLQMMQTLINQHGPVRHIVLGTVALEHKATLAAFASHYPTATVWLQPGQWSFPVTVPIEFYGLVQRGPRLREIPVPGTPVTLKQYEYYANRDPVPEWTADIDFIVLGPFQFRSVGAFSETAFFHAPTSILVVTDSVVSVTADPPLILTQDPRALLFHARDTATELVQDTPAVRRKGWRRMVQFGLVFFPSQIKISTVRQAFQEAARVPAELRNLGDGAVPGALYPWSWPVSDADQRSFDALSQKGRLLCPPILTKLILDREPVATLAWVDAVCQRWPDMKRIIPSHLNNNVQVAGSNEFYEAFEPLRSRPGNLRSQRVLGEDLALLQEASDLLTKLGIVAPSQVCDGEAARQAGRFASL